ncbi:MAG: hypothetical protein MI976_16095 [Pseudomonadales bacterium]|nr:hypothetical protein [Pseudomonadales bacterium]
MNSSITVDIPRKNSVIATLLDVLLPHFTHEKRHRHLSSVGVIGALIGYTVFATAMYYHNQVEPASMFTNVVSSLGWGPNGSHEIFKYGLTLVGLVLIPFVLFLIAKIRSEAAPEVYEETVDLTHKAITFWIIAVAGLWTLAWFIDIRVPEFIDAMAILGVHAVGALAYFSCSIIGSLYLNKALRISGHPYKLQYAIIAFVFFCTIGMGVGFIPTYYAGEELGIYERIVSEGANFTLTVEERIGLISQATKMAPWGAFCEWMIVLGMLTWFGVTGAQNFFHRSP